MEISAIGHTPQVVEAVSGLWQILAFPLIGAVASWSLSGESDKKQAWSGWIASAAAALSFLWVLRLFVGLVTGPTTIYTQELWKWIAAGRFAVDLSLRFDHLSGLMCMFVTGVGTLIHVYAIGYMAHDDARPRFFSYLNLFLFSMLVLVLGGNLLVLFIGWEGVGLCSYLLIGFWFKEMGNAKAGQKAFVVNRIGDAGFIIGMFILITLVGSLDFDAINALGAVGFESPLVWAVFLATFCLFIGATGKSAQIPLFVWLPDAMAGPTPVSALIHAATMVTAGVYMVTRLGPLFLASPVLVLMAIIGALTAFVAATIALVQNDIKKVLAYSTVSQLGYMFLALGVGALSNGMYHVVTHAFFKACLFMGAGSVIMGCHHEQDMREFGGLRKLMPITFITYLLATLAIAGFPYLSGAESKDLILYAVLSTQDPLLTGIHFLGFPLNEVLWGLAIFTAFLTAFYMTRSLVMTFFGSYRGSHHPHESPRVVTIPLIILAVLSAGFGYFYGASLIGFLAEWTRPDMLPGHHGAGDGAEHAVHLHHVNHLAAVIAAFLGIGLSWLFYGYATQVPAKIAGVFKLAYRFLAGKWWIDELYEAVIIRPLRFTSDLLFKVVDRVMVDGSVNGAGILVDTSGDLLSRLHVGRIGAYALSMLVGVLFVLFFWLLG